VLLSLGDQIEVMLLKTVIVILLIGALEISVEFAVIPSRIVIASWAKLAHSLSHSASQLLLRPWADFHHDLPAPLEWHSDR
jgi:hypothetical protein